MSTGGFQISLAVPRNAIPDLELGMRAALRAGKIIKNGYHHAHQIEEKGWGDLVSHIDRECDEAIQDEIKRAQPNDALLTEELNPETTVAKERIWIADPLDATSAFLFEAGKDMPSTMLALCTGGKPLLSIVYFPLTDEMFYAVKGGGAYKGRERLWCKNYTLSTSWIEMNQQGDSRHDSADFTALRDALRQPGGARLVTCSPPHSGAGVRIAEGQKQVAAVIHDNNAKKIKQAVWDVVPPTLILQEAGGVAINCKGKPYDPFKPEPFIMASSMALAKEIITLLPYKRPMDDLLKSHTLLPNTP